MILHITYLLAAAVCCGYIATAFAASDTDFCTADRLGGKHCEGKPDEHKTFSSTAAAVRYLLYDVNPPEGFNLRRDVFMRFAIFIRGMKKHGNWNMVLPPWGQLYHWQSSNVGEQKKLPWRMFFDIPSLQRFAPVIEMEEFFARIKNGGPAIDEVYVLQHYKDMWEEGREWQDRWDIETCIDNVPYTNIGKASKGPFWSYNNITAKKVSCVSFQGHTSLLAKLLKQSTAKSVMIDHAEVALHDSYGDREYWQARRSMRFALNLVQIAKQFRKDHLDSTDEADGVSRPPKWEEEKAHYVAGGGPYLAVHLRRKDFLWGRSKEVPDLEFAAIQLETILKKHKLNTIFVATDAPKPEFAELKSHLSKYKVLRFEPSATLKYKIKDGGVAIVDQIICSHAKFFIGTHESTFSFRIQEEREIMGFASNMTFNRLCGRQENIPCSQPTQWHIVF